MRGQGFVVFKEVAEATAAKKNLNGYPIFGKSMVNFISYLENYIRKQKVQSSNIWKMMMI